MFPESDLEQQSRSAQVPPSFQNQQVVGWSSAASSVAGDDDDDRASCLPCGVDVPTDFGLCGPTYVCKGCAETPMQTEWKSFAVVKDPASGEVIAKRPKGRVCKL